MKDFMIWTKKDNKSYSKSNNLRSLLERRILSKSVNNLTKLSMKMLEEEEKNKLEWNKS